MQRKIGNFTTFPTFTLRPPLIATEISQNNVRGVDRQKSDYSAQKLNRYPRLWERAILVCHFTIGRKRKLGNAQKYRATRTGTWHDKWHDKLRQTDKRHDFFERHLDLRCVGRHLFPQTLLSLAVGIYRTTALAVPLGKIGDARLALCFTLATDHLSAKRASAAG